MKDSLDLSKIYIREDGSYVVNQGLYHIPNEGEWVGMWQEVDAYVKEHPEVVEIEPQPEVAEPTLEELKTSKLTKVDTYTANKITGGFVSLASGEPVTYDSDKDTQLTMQGIALNVQTPLFATEYPNGCPVRGYPIGSDAKEIYMLNAEQVMRWCADLSMHIGTCKQRGWELQAQVKACTTKEELEAIVF